MNKKTAEINLIPIALGKWICPFRHPSDCGATARTFAEERIPFCIMIDPLGDVRNKFSQIKTTINYIKTTGETGEV